MIDNTEMFFYGDLGAGDLLKRLQKRVFRTLACPKELANIQGVITKNEKEIKNTVAVATTCKKQQQGQTLVLIPTS